MRHKSIMNMNVYEVAGHRFAIIADEELLSKMKQYEPFLVKDATVDGLVFTLKIVDEDEFPSTEGVSDIAKQDGEFVQLINGRLNGHEYFEYIVRNETRARMIINIDNGQGIVSIPNQEVSLYGINRATMMAYALMTSDKGTVMFHASVVEHRGKAYMFLGKSGTGKSTHSQLWIKYILGTQLVNDDCPIVRIYPDGCAVVYGSPWSGKTPCYRNVSYPIGGIVDLDQAPENSINRMTPIDAYAALILSITGKRWDKKFADGLHATENGLIKAVPVWHLYCRPDEEAAKLCYENVTNG